MQIDRLEEEKESLILQVSVLTDQVEAQGEKIRDTEFALEEMQVKLEDAEQQLEKVLTDRNRINLPNDTHHIRADHLEKREKFAKPQRSLCSSVGVV